MMRYERTSTLASLAMAVAVGVAYLWLGASLPLAGGAGIAAYLAGRVLGALASRTPPDPTPPDASPEAEWLVRADQAVASLARLAASAGPTALAERCRAIERQARGTTRALRRLAYQASVVASVSSPTAGERLALTHQVLADRVESTTTQIEALVARVAEIVAVQEAAPARAPLDQLACELDALHAALLETEELGRGLLQLARNEKE